MKLPPLTHSPFTFAFDATSDSIDAIPYVAKLTWNPALKRIEQHLLPLKREAISPTSTRVHGEFQAAPMEIIETRLGMLKKRKKNIERRAWYIVVPKGYLVLLGDGQDSGAKQRIDTYLAGTISIHELKGTSWQFEQAHSDWPALSAPASPVPTSDRIRTLQIRRQRLINELHGIDQELAALAGPKEGSGAENGTDRTSAHRNTPREP
jgi:hypothetical protein